MGNKCGCNNDGKSDADEILKRRPRDTEPKRRLIEHRKTTSKETEGNIKSPSSKPRQSLSVLSPLHSNLGYKFYANLRLSRNISQDLVIAYLRHCKYVNRYKNGATKKLSKLIYDYLLITRHGKWVHYKDNCNDDKHYTKKFIINDDLSFKLTMYQYDTENEKLEGELTFFGDLQIMDINTYLLHLDKNKHLLYEQLFLCKPMDIAGADIYVKFRRRGKRLMFEPVSNINSGYNYNEMAKVSYGRHKPKYADVEVQEQILNDDERKEESLELFTLNKGSLIRFCTKYLNSKIIDKMWNKIDRRNNGYIHMKDFPDLVTFIVIIYLTKRRQQQTKIKEKPQTFISNKQIRTEVEHIAVYIAWAFIYNENNEFILTKTDLIDKFAIWCQEYVDAEGFMVSNES